MMTNGHFEGALGSLIVINSTQQFVHLGVPQPSTQFV
jgi:hypothetical protein